jgi:3-oxoadipate enol-lactonase
VPFAQSGDHRIHWRAEGPPDAPPVLLIMGLGGSARVWFRLLPHLVARYRTLLFDNRGTGGSDPVAGPLSMDAMVADAVAVLDAAGVERAHVIGVSMGGMIAQHLALERRDRVASLVLGCTTAGGRRGAPPWRLLAASALRPVLGAERTWPLIAPALFAERTRRERPQRVADDLRQRRLDDTASRTLYAQLAAVVGHDTRAALPALAGLPTLVLHGAEDALVPVARGRELAALIPGACLVVIPGAGHVMTTDAEDAVARAIVDHLAVLVGSPA